MERHLAILAAEAQPDVCMRHLLQEKLANFHSISSLPPVSTEAVMVSRVFPLLSACPRGATSSKSTEVAVSFEKYVSFSFSFLYRLPSANPGGRRIIPLAGTEINVTCSGHVLTSPSPTCRLQGAPDRSICLSLSAASKNSTITIITFIEDLGANSWTEHLN